MWGWDVWGHNAYKFPTLQSGGRYWNGFQKWAKQNGLDQNESAHVWQMISQARKYGTNKVGSATNCRKEVAGIKKDVEHFKGQGYSLVTKSYGYGPNHRWGVDLVFEEATRKGSIFHIVEAKGYRMNSIFGNWTLSNGVGNASWTMVRLRKSANAGNIDSLSLLNNPNNRCYTSFRDASHAW